MYSQAKICAIHIQAIFIKNIVKIYEYDKYMRSLSYLWLWIKSEIQICSSSHHRIRGLRELNIEHIMYGYKILK